MKDCMRILHLSSGVINMEIKNKELKEQVTNLLYLTDRGEFIDLSKEDRDRFIAYLLKALQEVFGDEVEITQKDVENLSNKLLEEPSPITKLIKLVAEWLDGRL